MKRKRGNGRKRRGPSSDSGSRKSRHSFGKLPPPKGIGRSHHRLARGTARHTSLEVNRKPRGKSDAIVDRLGDMAEGDDRKAGNPRKIGQLTGCALGGSACVKFHSRLVRMDPKWSLVYAANRVRAKVDFGMRVYG